MKDKVNIDKLFQEKFQDFEVEPSEIVWENIDAILQKKKKRRVIPFWWKLSGVAAVFLIGLGLFNQLNSVKTQPNSNNTVVNTDSNTKNNEFINSNSYDNNNAIANEENNPKENSNVNNTTNESNDNNVVKNNSNTKTNTNQTKGIAIKENNSTIDNNKKAGSLSNENQVVQNSNNKLVKDKKVNNSPENQINNNTNLVSIKNENKLKINESDKKSIEKKPNSSNIQIVQNSGKETNQKENNNVTNDSKESQEKNNSSKYEGIAVTKNEKEILKSNDLKIKDTTSVASVVPNALEELLKEKEAKKIVEQKINRWQVTSSFAPVYFSSLSNGSPLDTAFVKNSKDFKTNFSYGAGVNYAINKKIKIRTGINAVSFSYKTNDVVFFQNSNAREIEHVKTNLQGSMIQVESKNANEGLEINPNGLVPNKFDSTLDQRFGYIEIPFEMSYKVLDKKFGIEFIGGMSSMILNKNEIYLESDGLTMNIGEADNLNKLHVSSNLGIGFNYKILKNLDARIEPIFKYQFNTFTTDSGNFKPYTMGIYSGISYTF